MAFLLRGFLTIDPAALALYGQVAPGGAEQAAPTAESGLPDGWVLRWFADLDDPSSITPGWRDPAALDSWARAAELPPAPVPLEAFSLLELQFASLLSLAAPAGIVLLDDQVFAGQMDWEYAAVFAAGKLRRAYFKYLAEGDDEPEQGFELDGDGYREVDPRALEPITDCAPVLDQRFEGRQIFDRYLPRSIGSPEIERRPLPAGPVAVAADAVRDWAPYFPILRRVSS